MQIRLRQRWLYLICVHFCRLKSEHSREAVRTHEDIESQRKQTEDMQEMLRNARRLGCCSQEGPGEVSIGCDVNMQWAEIHLTYHIIIISDAWFISSRYFAECGLSGSNEQEHNFKNVNGWLVPALDSKLCSLARSIRIQHLGSWKGIGGVIIAMIVSVLQIR